MKHDISTPEDIHTLVYGFYDKVRKDDLLAPVFNAVIKEEEWEPHLQVMVNFWRTNLLYEKLYTGNPIQMHIKANEKVHNGIKEAHFERWLLLWNQTIDEHFSGKTANETKKKASDIALVLLYKLENSQKKEYPGGIV